MHSAQATAARGYDYGWSWIDKIRELLRFHQDLSIKTRDTDPHHDIQDK